MKAGRHRQQQMHFLSSPSTTFFNLRYNNKKKNLRLESIFSSSLDQGKTYFYYFVSNIIGPKQKYKESQNKVTSRISIDI